MATNAVDSNTSCDPSYPSHLAAKLNDFRQQGTFCDVTVIIDDRRFPAHKAVLGASSSYFMSMFSLGFKESSGPEVTIPEGSAESFAQLVEFAYTGQFQLCENNVCGILRMACYMDFRQAIEVCVDYMVDKYERINFDDVFEIYCLADIHYPISVLGDILREYLQKCFLTLGETKSFLDHARTDFITMCLTSEEIETNTIKEEQILQCILKWLRHDWTNRQEHAPDLLRNIRLGLIQSSRLRDILGKDMLAIPECNTMVEEVLGLQSTPTTTSDQVQLIKSHPHLFATRNTITAPIFVEVQSISVCLHARINGVCYELGCSESFPGTCPTSLEIIHDSGNGYSSIVAGGQVYLAGGFGNGFGEVVDVWDPFPAPQCGFYKFDPHRGEWGVLPLMPVGLAYPALVELDGFIYAIGSSSENYHSVEAVRFNIVSRQWQRISPMLETLSDMSAVALNGHILVAGSVAYARSPHRFDSNEIQLYVFVLKPTTGKWWVAYEATVPFPTVVQGLPSLNQYPIQIFMHDDMCYFQSIKYKNGGYEVQVEEVVLDIRDYDGKPMITLGEEVDQVATFGALLQDKEVVSPSQLLTFDKNKMKLASRSHCSLPHNKENPFKKAILGW